ncbi:PTS sugar transporter subunit IIA [Lysobacter sp. LF1]|uniref:PTS sugar transporter subunit IIA n=1 Tax=Lysobacter stagni TaxID=3045172 RepID=A0ABT6XKD2_9GAMM|nr:PTS sugar transporter subunit IIA [Lysobacter sp. LF1]MDI9240627.1 PTS sugar transporter subunit IIA [Lysobacter sp. LF1]
MPLHDLLTAPRVAIMDVPAAGTHVRGTRARSSQTDPLTERDRVLDAAAGLLAAAGRRETVARALREREALASTALGEGVAIPHARCSDIEQCHGAFLRLTRPVDFAAADGRPVDLVLALLVPEHDIQPQLARLAELAERFADAGFRRMLREAKDVEQLRRHLLSGPSPTPLYRAA